MEETMIKVTRGRDLYMCWSMLVRGATFVGTREQCARRLTDRLASTSMEVLLDRADRYGTSAWGWKGHRRWRRPGSWSGPGLITETDAGPVWLPRRKFLSYAQACRKRQHPGRFARITEPYGDRAAALARISVLRSSYRRRRR